MVSWTGWGTFWRVGLGWDAEKALGHYQRSLEDRERLLVANPESAQAARDVSVSLNSWVTFWRVGAWLGTRRKRWAITSAVWRSENGLLSANPESAHAARDVSVSLNKLADFLASRGLAGTRRRRWAITSAVWRSANGCWSPTRSRRRRRGTCR